MTGIPTEACVIDDNYQIVGRGTAGRSFRWEHDKAVESIKQTVTEALSSAGCALSDVAMACASFTSVEWEDAYFPAYDLVEPILGETPFKPIDHASGSLAVAYRGGDGILVVAGGESQSLGVKGGKYAKAGGWGSVFGDEGTSTHITAEGLRAAARWADDRGIKTALLNDFCMTLDCSLRWLTRQIHDKHVDFPELCRVVFRCAEAGDAEAMRIVTKEARELVFMAKAVSTRLDMPSPRIALVGGCFRFPIYVEPQGTGPFAPQWQWLVQSNRKAKGVVR